MTIGTKIQHLRKQLNLTQEQVANAVGVSIPAVSKWETGSTMPDITLLSPIARMLETDVNDLLDFKNELSNIEVDRMLRAHKSTFTNESFSAGVQMSFDVVKLYPTNNYLKLKVANSILLYSSILELDCTEENFNFIVGRCEELLLSVYLNPSVNDHDSIGPSALKTLSERYIKSGRYDKAENLLTGVPKSHDYGLEQLKEIYYLQNRYEEAILFSQDDILKKVKSLFSDIHLLYKANKELGFSSKALTYARDYYTLGCMLQLPSIYPSELLLDLSITENDDEKSLQHFTVYIDEIIHIPLDFEHSNYFDCIKDYALTWHSGMNVDVRVSLYNDILQNSNYQELTKNKIAHIALKKLHEVIAPSSKSISK